MKLAYADPPYLGMGKKMYADHPEHAVYDAVEGHAALIARLVDEFPDGWALSLSVPSLRYLLPLCPDDVRIGAWTKGWCSWKPGVGVAYAWEPVIWRGGRQTTKERATGWTMRDWMTCNVTTGRAMQGAKPDLFCRWVFDLLGARPDDELVDIFPGTGAVTAAWEKYRGQPALALASDDRGSADMGEQG